MPSTDPVEAPTCGHICCNPEQRRRPHDHFLKPTTCQFCRDEFIKNVKRMRGESDAD